MKRPINTLRDVALVLLPTEAVCIVQVLSLAVSMGLLNSVSYAEDGIVELALLRKKIIDQVEAQREG